jgi:hypothetical protein
MNCFSNIGFMKNKLRNRLIMHLDLVVKMFVCTFFCLYMFPFALTMSTWSFAKFDMEQKCSWSNSKPLNLNHFPLCNSCSYFFHLE